MLIGFPRNAVLSTPCAPICRPFARTVMSWAASLTDDDSPVATVTLNRVKSSFMENWIFWLPCRATSVNYKQIIPKEYKTRVVANTADLLKAVRIAGFFARDGSSLLEARHRGGEGGLGADQRERSDPGCRRQRQRG